MVAFTATQIPGIAKRRYPPALAGPRYPRGIPIEDEADLETICRRERVTLVVFAYSDVTHAHVMTLASRALALGADFTLLGPERTMLRAPVPVVAVSAVRTGCGKSPIARWLAARLHASGRRVAVVRHPMPYGDLERQRVQRFATPADLDAAGCTIEEREEYEPHLAAGHVVFAGVDYAEILARAGAESDVLVWDGGNNDFPFVRPDLHLVVVDALRPDDAAGYHPGEAVLRMADVAIVSKVEHGLARPGRRAQAVVGRVNPRAPIVRAALAVRLDTPELVRGRRVLVVEDGPTITHGSMPYGAGFVAATARRRRHRRPQAVRDRRHCRRCSPGTRTSARCCRRSATARLRSRHCAPRSCAATSRSWWRRRRSISHGCSGSAPRSCALGMSSRTPASRPSPSFVDRWLAGVAARPSEARSPHPPRRGTVL